MVSIALQDRLHLSRRDAFSDAGARLNSQASFRLKFGNNKAVVFSLAVRQPQLYSLRSSKDRAYTIRKRSSPHRHNLTVLACERHFVIMTVAETIKDAVGLGGGGELHSVKLPQSS